MLAASRAALLPVLLAALFDLLTPRLAQAGPTQPPGGRFTGYRVRYVAGPYPVEPGQLFTITCFNPSGRAVDWGFEVFSGVPDPNRNPIVTNGATIDPSEVDALSVASGVGFQLARVLVRGRKDVIDCRAYVTNSASVVVYEVSLVPVGKKKR
jgi:hypothetical protein